MRNRQMIVRWLMANSKAIETRTRDGKTYYVMVDAKAFQEGVGRLLAEVQRIKAEGDYDAAVKLFETYGVHFDPKLRDEVVARVDRLKMPSYTGFVQPKLEAVKAADGQDHRRQDHVSAGPRPRRCWSTRPAEIAARRNDDAEARRVRRDAGSAACWPASRPAAAQRAADASRGRAHRGDSSPRRCPRAAERRSSATAERGAIQ